MDSENRAARRRRMLKAAKVVLSDWTSIDCTLRDISDTGARLEFAGVTELPKELRVLVVSTNLIYPAEVAWQKGLTAGVYFTGPARAAPARKT